MNILSFVSGFLLLIAISTVGLYQKGLQNHYIHKSSQIHMASLRKLHTSLNRNKFASYPSKPKPKQTLPSSMSKTKKTEKKKMAYVPAKVNIFALLNDAEEEKFYTKFLDDLLVLAYPKTFFSDEQERKAFLNAFIALLKQEQEIAKKNNRSFALTLEKIRFENPLWQQKYYRLLKGTKAYNQNSNNGYPSLLQLLCLNVSAATEKLPISFLPELIQATLFSPKIAQAIQKKAQFEVKKKKIKFYPLQSDELEKILLAHHFQNNSQIMTKCVFPKKAPGNSSSSVLTYTDKKTDIQIKVRSSL